MKSRRTKRFHELFDALPEQVQRDANAAYARLRADLNYPGLHFKRLQGYSVPLYSARVNEQYRALDRGEQDDTIV